MSELDRIDLSLALERDEYARRLKAAQEELTRLALRMERKQRTIIIVFEGMDAAGKGGAIRRLTQALDPALYRVLAYGAPNERERNHHYLWRFWDRFPFGSGSQSMVVFDRSWYGRVLVERVEGFASDAEWGRAYEEINDMERGWTQAGVILVKFWLQIDLDEQLRRFEARRTSPLKQWKLTDEDWRNREKWPRYKEAIEAMLARTTTPEAPWTLVAANDKLYARVKVVETVVRALGGGKKSKK